MVFDLIPAGATLLEVARTALAVPRPPQHQHRIGNATRTRRSGEWGHQRSPVEEHTDETRRYNRG